MSYVPHTPEDRAAMKTVIGISQEDELITEIPAALRQRAALNLPAAASELELRRRFGDWAAANRPAGSMLSFLGAGAYDHAIPAVVDQLISRSEFYTAYTPYQAEMSQGLLQSMYEFQSMICELTALDVANASLYDGGSALAEAVLMAMRITKRSSVAIASTVHPHYRQVVKSYLQGLSCTIELLPSVNGVTDPTRVSGQLPPDCAAVVVQQPNFFGCLEEVDTIGKMAHDARALLVAVVDPISLGLLSAPGHYGADIAVGEGQPLGIPLCYGGPYLGFLAARRDYMRQLPGRIVGATVDHAGRRGYCLTLQAREQHIRRARATSNICTNQALTALAATVYLAEVGPAGLREVATHCWDKAHYLQQALCQIPGVSAPFPSPFFKEFVIDLPIAPDAIERTLAGEGILPGLSLAHYGPGMDRSLLCCVTEKRTRYEMDRFVMSLGRALERGAAGGV